MVVVMEVACGPYEHVLRRAALVAPTAHLITVCLCVCVVIKMCLGAREMGRYTMRSAGQCRHHALACESRPLHTCVLPVVVGACGKLESCRRRHSTFL